MQYDQTPEFARDLKKLLKKFRSLNDDLEVVKRNAIKLYHCRGLDNLSVFQIPNTGSASLQIYKVKKFACKTLKGKGNRSGLRLIYAYEPQEMRVTFLELYHKAGQTNEDRDRIRSFIRNHKSR